MRLLLTGGSLLALVALVLAVPTVSSGESPPAAHAAATCADYDNQAAAQRAADTRDPDRDGVYCEDLPCPCSTAAGGESGGGGETPGDEHTGSSCVKPKAVQRLVFSAHKYRHIRAHFRAAVRKGWPTRLVLNRKGADARRDRLLRGVPTKDGFDRDEYPAAVLRGRGPGLERGTNPRGWKADVRYVRSSENRSHGSVLGAKLAGFCNGTRVRYVFR
jgi:hypothetical protein